MTRIRSRSDRPPVVRGSPDPARRPTAGLPSVRSPHRLTTPPPSPILLSVGCWSSSARVLRGGSWNNNANRLRSAYRNHNHPANSENNSGFRVAKALTLRGLSRVRHRRFTDCRTEGAYDRLVVRSDPVEPRPALACRQQPCRPKPPPRPAELVAHPGRTPCRSHFFFGARS